MSLYFLFIINLLLKFDINNIIIKNKNKYKVIYLIFKLIYLYERYLLISIKSFCIK